MYSLNYTVNFNLNNSSSQSDSFLKSKIGFEKFLVLIELFFLLDLNKLFTLLVYEPQALLKKGMRQMQQLSALKNVH